MKYGEIIYERQGVEHVLWNESPTTKMTLDDV